jgi:hypothetical protein
MTTELVAAQPRNCRKVLAIANTAIKKIASKTILTGCRGNLLTVMIAAITAQIAPAGKVKAAMPRLVMDANNKFSNAGLIKSATMVMKKRWLNAGGLAGFSGTEVAARSQFAQANWPEAFITSGAPHFEQLGLRMVIKLVRAQRVRFHSVISAFGHASFGLSVVGAGKSAMA